MYVLPYADKVDDYILVAEGTLELSANLGGLVRIVGNLLSCCLGGCSLGTTRFRFTMMPRLFVAWRFCRRWDDPSLLYLHHGEVELVGTDSE